MAIEQSTMTRLSEYGHSVWERNRKLLTWCLQFTCFWVVLAHLTRLTAFIFSHDSLREFNQNSWGYAWKVSLGRFIYPVYREVVGGQMTMPWISGLLGIVWIALSVFLVMKCFQSRSRLLAFLISAVFATNITVTATLATYIHDFDCNMFALLLSCLSAYCCLRGGRYYVLAIVSLIGALGIYQAFVCVTLGILWFSYVLRLLKKDCLPAVFKIAVKDMLVCGVSIGVYYVLMHSVSACMRMPLITKMYNSPDMKIASAADLIHALGQAYYGFLRDVLVQPSCWAKVLIAAGNLLLLSVSAYGLVRYFRRQRVTCCHGWLLVALAVVLPFLMRLTTVAAGGMCHQLMTYSVSLVYVFEMVLLWQLCQEEKQAGWQWLRAGWTVVFLLLQWSNVAFANQVYLKKALEWDAALSLYTRINERMEAVEGYQPGKHRVVFIGGMPRLDDDVTVFDNMMGVIGLPQASVMGRHSPFYYKAYFNNVLKTSLNVVASYDEWDAYNLTDKYDDLPVWPAKGCMKLEGDTLVVKLHERAEQPDSQK